METRAHHVLIGLSSVIVIGAALLFGLWLAKSGSEGKFNYYDIVFNEAVSGLSQGSSVQYSGIKVGDVASASIRRTRARHASAWWPARRSSRTPPPSWRSPGSPAPRSSSSARPPARCWRARTEDPGDRRHALAATQLSNGEDLMGNINQLIARFSNLLSEENTARISRTLDHLDQATGALSAERENVSAVMQQLAQASRQATPRWPRPAS